MTNTRYVLTDAKSGSKLGDFPTENMAREAASRFTREVDTVRRTPAAALTAEAYRCAVRLANVSGKTVSIREVSGRIVLEVGP